MIIHILLCSRDYSNCRGDFATASIKVWEKPHKCTWLEVSFIYPAFPGHQWRAMLDTIFVVTWLSEAKCVLARSGLQSYSIGEERSHRGMAGERESLEKREVPWPAFLLRGMSLRGRKSLRVKLSHFLFMLDFWAWLQREELAFYSCRAVFPACCSAFFTVIDCIPLELWTT